ncbi:MAG: formimidoylglutamate deiminase [Rhizomicrobium sp.]
MTADPKTIFAAWALTDTGWQPNLRIHMTGGIITALTPAAQAEGGDMVAHALLPGLCNVHSHAFQRGMAGLAERRGHPVDSFWTWREVMYRFAHTLSPDQMCTIAAQVYVEMLEAGFTRIGEFHYLHHDCDGAPYADRGEMAGQIAAAADQTGINLTLLPVFYAHSDFGAAAPSAGQRRFINDLDGFHRLMERARIHLAGHSGWRLGVAPHSLRAVSADELQALCAVYTEGPFHIHAAEQLREVEDCKAFYGARPIEWLLHNTPVDARWCLIHATHLTDAEIRGLAACAAVAGLCPITESNLGDGIFPAAAYLKAGGRFGIGSDSNIQISAETELRMLEYLQRVHLKQRAVLAAENGSTGRALFDAAYAGGAQCLGDPGLGLAVGAPADMVALGDALGLPAAGDTILDRWIFTDSMQVRDVWVAGQQVVQAGRHVGREAIAAAFARTVRAVMAS